MRHIFPVNNHIVGAERAIYSLRSNKVGGRDTIFVDMLPVFLPVAIQHIYFSLFPADHIRLSFACGRVQSTQHIISVIRRNQSISAALQRVLDASSLLVQRRFNLVKCRRFAKTTGIFKWNRDKESTSNTLRLADSFKHFDLIKLKLPAFFTCFGLHAGLKLIYEITYIRRSSDYFYMHVLRPSPDSGSKDTDNLILFGRGTEFKIDGTEFH